VWCVLRRPELQRKIELEVAQLPESFTDKDIEALPTLNNTIDETQRLYNAAQGLLPRIVPKGGATIAGYFLPEGTAVGAQHKSLAMVPELFEDPKT
jgi:cytochrome P450